MTDVADLAAEQRDDDQVAFRIPAPGPWRALGRCRNAPHELFFPERGDDVRQAKKLCAQCPVIDECRAYAIPHSDLYGIWGGMSDKERRSARAALRARADTQRIEQQQPTPKPRPAAAPGSLYAVLDQLAAHPGVWARVGQFAARGSATTTASLLRTGRRPLPPGRWEFEGRPLDTGGSALWARLIPDERLATEEREAS